MIKYQPGSRETVDYRNSDARICLYLNTEEEDYPPHWHASFEVIMPVESGYRAKVSGNEYDLREGDILFICPNVVHELFAPACGTRIIFQPELTAASIGELSLLLSTLPPAFLVTPEDYPLISEQLQTLLFQIRDEYFSSAPFSETIIFGKFLEMLVLFVRNRKESGQLPLEGETSRSQEYINRFLFLTSYIDQHYMEDFTLEKAASLTGFSKYHFSRLFKEYIGYSFYKYLNQKRIDQAKLLLSDPQVRVIDAASQVGFCSLSAFLRMFRQLTGCSPSEFRGLNEAYQQKIDKIS